LIANLSLTCFWNFFLVTTYKLGHVVPLLKNPACVQQTLPIIDPLPTYVLFQGLGEIGPITAAYRYGMDVVWQLQSLSVRLQAGLLHGDSASEGHWQLMRVNVLPCSIQTSRPLLMQSIIRLPTC